LLNVLLCALCCIAEDDLPPAPEDDSLPPPPAPDDDFFPPPPSEFVGQPSAPAFSFDASGDADLPPPPSDYDEGPIRDIYLNETMKRKDINKLTSLVKEYEAKGHNSSAMRQARNLLQTQAEQSHIIEETQAALASCNAIELRKLLKGATALGMNTNDPLFTKAREMAYAMNEEDALQMKLSTAIQHQNFQLIAKLIKEGAENGINVPAIEEGRRLIKNSNFVYQDAAEAHSSGAPIVQEMSITDFEGVNRAAAVSMATRNRVGSIVDSYGHFIATRGTMPLESFRLIRKEENYAKRLVFSRKTKDSMFTWQKGDIPRSLVKLSTQYCGGKDKSKAIKTQAHTIFKDIRMFMGDLYHQYPASLALEILLIGGKEPLLRDEIYCELIKQTTKNPNSESVLAGLKLFYLAIATFKPSDDLMSIIMSHLSQFAHNLIPKEMSFQSAADVASNCFIVYEAQTKKLSGAEYNDLPTVAEIEKIRAGFLVKQFNQPEERKKEKPMSAGINTGAAPPAPSGRSSLLVNNEAHKRTLSKGEFEAAAAAQRGSVGPTTAAANVPPSPTMRASGPPLARSPSGGNNNNNNTMSKTAPPAYLKQSSIPVISEDDFPPPPSGGTFTKIFFLFFRCAEYNFLTAVLNFLVLC
jgi:hypothetical protein